MRRDPGLQVLQPIENAAPELRIGRAVAVEAHLGERAGGEPELGCCQVGIEYQRIVCGHLSITVVTPEKSGR